MAFQLVQIIFWLALATWFGAVLFVAVAAPVIFRTVRESNPLLPTVLSVNLENQHGTLLAGTIVSNILSHLRVIQAACAFALLAAVVAHFFVLDLSGPNGRAAVVRGALLLAAIGLLLFDWFVTSPRLAGYRQEYLDHADDPDVANPAKENFDALHARSVTTLQALLFCLLGMILFSASVSPRPRAGSLSDAAPAVENNR